MTRPDGGPAFPCEAGALLSSRDGMSRRFYAAVQIAAAIAPTWASGGDYASLHKYMAGTATVAFMLADYLLAQESAADPQAQRRE